MTRPTPGTGVPPAIHPNALAWLVNLAEDAIIVADQDQRIVLFNPGAERTFGYLAGEVVGRPLGFLLPERFANTHAGHVAGFAGSPEVARAMGERRPVIGLRKDGTEFPAEVTISKYRDEGRLYFNAILRDVTERQRAEDAIRASNLRLEARVRERTAELETANRQLARQNEENEAFVYSVSHDLRAPLVNLEGFSRELALACRDALGVLADPGVPPAVRARAEAILDRDVAESIGYIQTAVGRLSGIIDGLLRLSRAGRVHYEPQTVAPGLIVGRVVQSLRLSADAKGAVVTVGALPDAWADPSAVERVFANLIANALAYLAPGRPGRVEIGAVAPGEPGLRTYFVRDNGVGIPEGSQGQLFQPFRRLHADLAPGEGMGLALVKRVVDRLGGRIWFESAAGVGTTFFFTLPAGPTGGDRPGAP